MPWKNGGGTTTEIAVHPQGASLDAFDWRISMAHVGGDGPFSSFPGVDRTLAVLRGDGIRLALSDGETITLDRQTEPFAFAADRSVAGQLVAGPIDDLNVMSRRGGWAHAMWRLTGPGPHALDAGAGLLVLVAHAGDWKVTEASRTEALAPGDSALLEGPAKVELSAAEADGELFVISLLPLA
ncbi:HutD family protein [Bosea sp. 685]|uniref:HutD/Ves family protein n=1 Tax=Bosea sp. 685 TaxID=3080057 RepID=UPI00289336BD|nr:HutD family protein [Bosea sp. 685]WNJ89469.1 HutD family protein [Bosea sp. 685]